MKTKYILQLQTFPACSIGFSESGLTKFRKELIKVGSYIKESTGQKLDVALDTLKHWVKEFNHWTTAGNKVPIPLGHDRVQEPEKNEGWVTSMFIEGNSLYGILELLNPELALTTDVSIAVTPEVVDGKGVKYENIISHVALCIDPVVPGLGEFETMSFSKGAKMNFLQSLALKLGLKKETPTEADILLAIENSKPADKVVEPVVTIDPIAKLVSESREMKLSGLVKAGIITPAVKDLITTKYVKAEVVALELSTKNDKDAFDFLYNVLVSNRPVKLEEVTGIQSIELSNPSVVASCSPMKKEINRRRKNAGMKE